MEPNDNEIISIGARLHDILRRLGLVDKIRVKHGEFVSLNDLWWRVRGRGRVRVRVKHSEFVSLNNFGWRVQRV